MYKINELKKLRQLSEEEDKRAGRRNLERMIDKSLYDAAVKGINYTSIFFFNLSMISINVDSDYFEDYLEKLRDEGYKVEVIHVGYFSQYDDDRKLMISWED